MAETAWLDPVSFWESGICGEGARVVFIFMFLLPNLITSNIKQLQNFRENLRIWSIVIGVGAQAIGFLLVKKTHDKLKKIEGDEQNDKP